MSTEEKDVPNGIWKKFIYCAVFTAINLLGVYFITKQVNWLLIFLVVILTVFGIYIILADTFENIGEHFNKNISHSFQAVILPIIIIAIILIAYADKFIPGGGAIKKLLLEQIQLLTLSMVSIALVIVIKRDYKFKKIIENINDIEARLIKYNPLYSTEPTFKNAIRDLQNVSIKDVALDFSIDSLRQMGNIGFLKIDVSFGEYTQTLLDIVCKSKKSVMGSFTFRPKLIYDDIESNPNANNNSNLKYLELLNGKTYSNKIRLVILSKDEIKEILSDALNSMKIDSKATFDQIPEVKWFNEQASKGFKVFWTSKNMFYSQFVANESEEIKKLVSLPDNHNSVTDFAIFDGDLLITWRLNVENKSDMSKFGTLLISWNDSISIFNKQMSKEESHQSAKHLYTDFMALVNKMKTEDESIMELAVKIQKNKKDGYKWENNYLPIN